MHRTRLTLALVMVVIAGVIAASGEFGERARAQGSDDQGILAGFVSRLLSTPTSRVTIGAVDGALSSDSVIRDITVADDRGVYLRIDRIRLVWRRAALLQRRVEVDRLEIGRIDILRRPGVTTGDPEPGPILPEVPLSLRVERLVVNEVALGEPVLGMAARFAIDGSASLGRAAAGLRATLAIRRLDRAGRADLSLAFLPTGERLTLRLAHDEPADGILSRLAGLPGSPPVRLDLQGDGTLDDWRATLAFNGGPDLSAQGTARIVREGAMRVLSLGVTGRVAQLLPPVVRPVFEGETALTGDVRFRDDGNVELQRLQLSSPLAQADVSGTIDQNQVLNLVAQARALPNADDSTVVGGQRLERFTFDVSVTGTPAQPDIRAALDLAGYQSPELAIQSLTARLALTSRQGLPQLLDLEARGSGVVPANAGLAVALGRDVSLSARGTLADGVIEFSQAEVRTPVTSLTYRGKLGAGVADGRISAEFQRLADLSALAGRQLGGTAQLSAALTGTRLSSDPNRLRLRASVNGSARALTLADARLDALLGPILQLNGDIALTDGTLVMEALRLQSAALDARLAGRVNATDTALAAAFGLSDIGLLDPRLSGRASATAHVRGLTADPEMALSLSVPEATALQRPVRTLAATVNVQAPFSLPRLTASAAGQVGGKPLVLDLQISAQEADRGRRAWSAHKLVASLGSVSLDGSGRISAENLIDGRGTLNAGDLDDVSPLFLRKLSGGLQLAVTATATETEGQSLTIAGEGNGLGYDAIKADQWRASLALTDAWRAPRLRGESFITGLQAGSARFEKLALKAVAAAEQETDLTVSGQARGFDLAGQARILGGVSPAFRIDTFRAARGARVLALAAPAMLTFVPGGVRTENLRIAAAGGQVSLAGVFGSSLDAVVRVTSLPLDVVSIVAPSLTVSGVMDGQATLTGTPQAPRGPFSLNVRGFNLPAARAAGVPPLDIAVTGNLVGDAAKLDATVRSGRGIAFATTGVMPLTAGGRLDLSARGTLDAALANAQLASAGQRLAGRLTIDATVKGSPLRPEVRGAATLTGGSFSDAVQGVRITALEARARADGAVVVIERLSGRTRGDGTVALAGRVVVDPARGFPSELRLTARRAELVDSGLARLIANADLALTGALTQGPRITGRLDVILLDVKVPERLGASRGPLSDASHIAPPAQTRARLAQLARGGASRQARRSPSAGSGLALDVTVDAPGRIFLRGRGLDAELGGTLRLTGTTRQPVALGAFDLRRGRLTVLTQRLDFSRGELRFVGSLVPELDFIAETRAGDVTARVAVSGPADQPAFAFSSSPALPEDEVLSRLLFARAAGGLSPFQAIQLAQAVGQLSGEGGPDVFENARRALGVDNLDITTGADGPGIGISRAISDRARIGVKAGATPQMTGIGIDIDLTRRLRLQGEIGADGRASAGVGIETEY